MAHRIAIIGSPGSGKSTLARALGERLDLPVHHLDELYWRPGPLPTPAEEWRTLQEDLISGPSWIVDGTFSATLPARLARADAIVYLDLPWPLCAFRVLRRRVRHALRRERSATNAPVYLDLQLLRWLVHFRRDHRRAILAVVSSLPEADRRLLVARTRSDVRSVVHALTREP